MSSYLLNHTFKTRVGKAASQEFKVISGVPQGSVLGPLLFHAFVDQIFDVKLSTSARLIYADDLVYAKPIPSPNGQSELERDIESLSEKYRDIELELNFKKCKSMMINPSNKSYKLLISLNDEQFRYLGVDLDPKMSYKHHVGRIVTKCKQAIGALCRIIRKWAPISIFETLYKSTIEPIITYAIEA
jgi:ribonucleases P/MRP protein subunit RPP40